MPMFKDNSEVLRKAREFREEYSKTRQSLALYESLADAYAIGNQWRTVSTPSRGRDPQGMVWETNFNIGSNDLRVIDNKLAPLLRRAIADMQPASIEAKVTSHGDFADMFSHDLARVSERILNGLSDNLRYTPSAQWASFMRTIRGSYLLLLRLSDRERTVQPNVARDVDGNPLTINDRWLVWESAPFTDLVLDPSNSHPDLYEHESVMLDQIMSLEKFERLFGPVDSYGVDREDLPTVRDLAPYYAQASELTGGFAFNGWSASSNKKAVRLMQWYIADPNRPGTFPIAYFILDMQNDQRKEQGIIINDGRNPFGTSLPIEKLDMYDRPDTPHGAGFVHTQMTASDLNNMLVSLQFQQMANNAHGQWVIDRQAADRNEFINQLNEGAGSVLVYNSKKHGKDTMPPQRQRPIPLDSNLVLLQQALLSGMRDAAHLSPQNLGIGKSHVPQGIAQQLLQQAGTVKDARLVRDMQQYSRLLKTTLLAIRRFSNAPNSLLDVLQSKGILDNTTFAVFTDLDVSYPQVTVRVREESIILRSTEEQIESLRDARNSKVISENEYLLAMADDMHRPVVKFHGRQLEHARHAVREIVGGLDWPGSAGYHPDIFNYAITEAITQLDLSDPADQEVHDRLSQALLNQIEFDNRLAALRQQAAQQGQQSVQPPRPPAEDRPLPTVDPGVPRQPPESVNPAVNVAGAAGGFPLGITGV